MVPLVYLAVEVFALAIVWGVTRLRGEQARRLRVVCPLDGEGALLRLVGAGRDVTPLNVVACNLLRRDHTRSCDRACVRNYPLTERTR